MERAPEGGREPLRSSRRGGEKGATTQGAATEEPQREEDLQPQEKRTTRTVGVQMIAGTLLVEEQEGEEGRPTEAERGNQRQEHFQKQEPP